MNYAFPDIDPNTTGAIYNVPVPLSRYLDASYDAAQHDTVLNSLNRMSEFSAANSDESSPLLDTKTANEKWGMGSLKFEEPVRESVARVMNQRKRDEMDREFFLSQGSSKGRFIPGMAASLLGAVSNPLDLGLMLVPFVGEEAAAAKATTAVGRIAARRLITRETLQNLVPQAPRLTESVINGVVGQTMFEIPNIIASHQDMADYGPKQAAFNILVGGGFAAGLHGAGVLLSKLSRGTREEMVRQALNQVMKDDRIRVDQFVHVDEAAILEKLKFDADAARVAAYENITVDDVAEAVRQTYGEVVESPAIRTSDGEIHFGESHDKIWYGLDKETRGPYNPDNEGFVTDKGRFISRDEAGKLVGIPDKGYNHLLHQNDKLMSEQISTANPEQLGAAEFDRYNQLIEENPHLSKVDALKKIMEERGPRRDRYLMEQPEILKLVEEERVKAIAKFIEDERIKFEQEKQGKFDAMKQAEIDRQIAEGKVLKQEEIQKATPAREHDGSQDADLDKDIEGLKKDLDRVEQPQQQQQGRKPAISSNDTFDFSEVRKLIDEETAIFNKGEFPEIGAQDPKNPQRLAAEKVVGKLTTGEWFALRGALFYTKDPVITRKRLLERLKENLQDNIDEISGGAFVMEGEGSNSPFVFGDRGLERNKDFKFEDLDPETKDLIDKEIATAVKMSKRLETLDISPKRVEPPNPKIGAIQAAVDCVLKKII